MVSVIYKKNRITKFIVEKPLITWQITKKYRLNPLTNQDHGYNPDYYEQMCRAQDDPRTIDAHPEAWRVRAIQTMLHQQTNYNQLIKTGLYDLPEPRVSEILSTWYHLIAQRFPKYRVACEFEFRRHLRRYHAHMQVLALDQ